MEFAVKAETHDGNVMTLRRGFDSQDAAEDHPVQISLWKRVWVEELPVVLVKQAELPPRPWSLVPANNRGAHIWICDATGKKIMTIWGSIGERHITACHVLDLVNDAHPPHERKNEKCP